MAIPRVLIDAALIQGARIGRDYDSTGKHIAFWLRVTDDWKVYRHSVRGMLVCLKQHRESQICLDHWAVKAKCGC